MLKNLNSFSYILVISAALALSCSAPNKQSQESAKDDKTEFKWSIAFADHILETCPDPNTLSNKGWEYNNSIILHGIEKVYNKTGDEKYLAYIKNFVDQYVNEDGSIRDLEPESNNLDKLHPGIILFPLYEKFEEEKYKLAAEATRAEFDNQPKTDEGGFWHKQRYETEMWLDGIYMAEPFLANYGAIVSNENGEFDKVTKQVKLISEKTYNPETGLFVHAWDSNKNAEWADPESGQSSFAWSRGLGWFAMALVDILEVFPADHPERETLVGTLDQVLKGVARYQDEETGLWYQVLDMGDKEDNWIEVSGSAMFIYSIQKGLRLGIVDSTYDEVAKAGWKGLQTKVKMVDGKPVVFEVVEGMGVQPTYEDYISKEQLENSTHGLCAILMAASEMEF